MSLLDKRILELSKNKAIISLLESGVDVNFIDIIIDRLSQAVGTSTNINDLIDELQGLMVSTSTNKSLLQRYISQVTSDSITQFNAVHTQTLTQGTTIQFYYYDGTKIENTRPFCAKHQQKYYHKKEVELLGKGKEINGSTLTSDQLKGRITGTNESNIFIYRGGYNCRHQFAPVSIFSVPKDVIQRALSKGFLTLTPQQKAKLGL